MTLGLTPGLIVDLILGNSIDMNYAVNDGDDCILKERSYFIRSFLLYSRGYAPWPPVVTPRGYLWVSKGGPGGRPKGPAPPGATQL